MTVVHCTLLISSIHYANDEFSYAAGRVFAGGEYYIRVYSANESVTQNIPYELYFCIEDTSKEPSMRTIFEFEPNNEAAYANYVGSGGAILGNLSSMNDKDYISFAADGVTGYAIGTFSDFDQNEAGMDIYNQNGVWIAPDGSEYQKLAAGTYHIVLTPKSKSFDWANDGRYVLYILPENA